MELKINSVSFQGKKEVLYALTKAAQKSKDFEYYNQPAIASRIPSDKLQTAQNSAINAYLDMALRDSEFKNVVIKSTNKDLSYIKELLATEKTEHSLVEPMKKFTSSLHTVVSANYAGKKKETMIAIIHELQQKLKL